MRQHLHKVFYCFLIFISYSLPSFGQIYTMNGTPITSCTGFFMDSGGGANGYGNNENFTTTLCSDGSVGTHIQLHFSSIDIGAGETFVVYDAATAAVGTELDAGFLATPGNPFILQATAANASGCLTIVFTSDGTNDNNAGWSAAINCIASCQTILSDLVSTIPAAMPQDTGWINICPGDRVEFFGSGIYPQNNIIYNHSNLTSSFEWNFGDGNTAVGPNVTNVFEEPGGYIVQLKITDQFGCENTNFISQRIRVSTYPTFIFDGTLEETYCTTDTIRISSSADTLSTNNVNVFPNVGSFQQTLVLSNPLLLPDGTGAAYQTSLSFTEFSPGAILTNPNDIINITLDIEHSYGGDLDIELICPDGSSIFILDYPSGIGSTNFGEPFASAPVDGESNDLTLGTPYTYVFVNTAANGTLVEFDSNAPTYNYTTVPSENTGVTHDNFDSYFPAGEYEPEEPFSNLLGCPLNGDWTIRVQDNLNFDNGWLTEWSMTFADYLYPNLETYTPSFVNWGWINNPTVLTSTQNMLEAAPVNAGIAAYTFWTLDNYGCLNDTTLHFEILPPTHPDCYECDVQINEQEDIVICEGDATLLDLQAVVQLEECTTFERFPQDLIGFSNYPASNPYLSPLMVNSINPPVITNPLEDICSVCINFSTDFLADINIALRAPNGVTMPLTIGNGGISMLGYANTCFTPGAAVNIENANPPFTGEFQPEGNWNALTGSPINGEWTLLITDAFGINDFGELIQWSISFNNINEYNYSWTPAAGLSCDDCDTPMANPAISTTYDVFIEDSYGCTRQETIEVGVILDVPAPMVSCTPDSNAVIFVWDDIPGITEFEYNISINNIEQGWIGPYTGNTLTVGSLINYSEVSIEVRPYFANNINNCPVATGTSSCSVAFCTLVINDALISGVSCFDETNGSLLIQPIAGEAPFTYQISGDPTIYDTPLFENLAAGNYTYTVADTVCNLSFDIEITTPDSLFADAAQTFISCFNLNESIAEVVPGGGSGSGYSFSWNDGQNTPVATELSPGNYTVLITDANSCTVNTMLTVVELTPIQFDLTTEDPSCNGFNDGSADITQVNGGIGQAPNDYTYTWSDNSQAMNRTDLSGGINYTITVADAQGCEAIISRFIQDPAPIIFSIQAAEPSCYLFSDGSAEVLNIVGPGNTTYNIQWDAAAGNQQTALAGDLAAGVYNVIVEDEETGCTSTDNVTISQPEELLASFAIENNECFSDSNGRIQTQVDGGTPSYTYLWSNGANEQDLDNLLAGDYTLTITDNRSCELIQTLNIEEPDKLEAIITPVAISCYGERDGMFEIETTGGTPPFRYSSGDNFFLNSSTLIGLRAGEYTIVVKDQNACEYSALAMITEPEELDVDAGADIRILFGDSIELSAIVTNEQGIVDMVWDAPYEGTLSCMECFKPLASPDFTIDYEVYIIDENGCIDTDMIRVFVDKPKLLVVPTGFTPNNDNVNDLLIVHGKPGTLVMDFQVFDRWGELVYQAEEFPVNSNIGWNGEFRSNMMNSGVYVWYAVALHEDGTEEVYKGQTTLIR